MLDAIILDVGGVLLVPHPEPVEQALAPLGVSVDAERAVRAHFVGIRALDATDPASDRYAYLTAYARALGIPDTQLDQALGCLRALWRVPAIDLWRQPIPGSAEALRRLAASGRKLAIVSNSDGSVERQLQLHRICQVGEGLGVPVLAVIDSAVVGVAKPAAEIFRHALEPLGVEPERAAYVGDTLRYDVAGARAAGLQPVHFDPYTLCPERDDHPHVRALAELETVV